MPETFACVLLLSVVLRGMWHCAQCTFYCFPACFFPAVLVFAGVNPLRLPPVVLRPLFMWDTRSPDGNQRYIPGGYCGGVPPLPIPNREVKPACADGTAMQCGRVGGRLLSSWRASGTEVPQALLLVFYEFYKLTSEHVSSQQVINSYGNYLPSPFGEGLGVRLPPNFCNLLFLAAKLTCPFSSPMPCDAL